MKDEAAADGRCAAAAYVAMDAVLQSAKATATSGNGVRNGRSVSSGGGAPGAATAAPPQLGTVRP